jgi:hypothetical protein
LEVKVPAREFKPIKEVTTAELPTGMTVQQASVELQYMEIEKLREQAREQAERFEVLNYLDVKALSRVSGNPWDPSSSVPMAGELTSLKGTPCSR